MKRQGFTLIELLFVMMVITVLAGISMAAYSAAVSQSRTERTRAIIAKLDQLITGKYESYRTRPVPVRAPPGARSIGEPFVDSAAHSDLTNGFYDDSPETYSDQAWKDLTGDGIPDANNVYDWGTADLRLLAMRELMRLEMPNIKADVIEPPLVVQPPLVATPTRVFPRPAASVKYLRKATATWTTQHEGAECLYLIIAGLRDGDDNGLDYFAPSEIGDVDGDGMNEILDAWGNPIEFIRWPAGYSEHPGADGAWGVAGVDDDNDNIQDNPSEAGTPNSDDILPPPTPQTRNFKKAPDPFDPLKVDGRYRLPNNFIVPFALKPLVYSAGPDKTYAVRTSGATTAMQLCDPYRVEFAATPPRLSAGSPYDPDGNAAFADNITNHDYGDK